MLLTFHYQKNIFIKFPLLTSSFVCYHEVYTYKICVHDCARAKGKNLKKTFSTFGFHLVCKLEYPKP